MITRKLRNYVQDTATSQVGKFINEYIDDIDEELKTYIKGPIDREGKPFVWGSDVKPPDTHKGTLKNVTSMKYCSDRGAWQIFEPLSYCTEESFLVDFHKCQMIEEDSLEKIKEEAITPYNIYWEKRDKKFTSADVAIKEMRLDLIERTEKVIRRECAK